MPLPEPQRRELLTERRIQCHGYLREDGLLDVDGRLVDARGYDTRGDWRGEVPKGSPVHEMHVRLTFDDQLVIREVAAATEASPYLRCLEPLASLQRLVGLSVTGGFKKEVRQRIGGTQGCTHVVALLDAMSNVAVHALAGKRRNDGLQNMLNTYGTRSGAHPLVGSCHTYAADSPVVARLWPEHYRPAATAEDAVDGKLMVNSSSTPLKENGAA